MIKIETGVPLPKRIHRKYPFRTLAVGHSFLVKPNPGQTLAQLRATVYTSSRLVEFRKFLVRVDKASGGVRCWRTA